MNRKGMEIAIDTLVVIIIGVVLLGGGIIFVTKIIGLGNERTDQVNEELANEVRRTSFQEGKLVAVFAPRATVQRGEDALFLFGIANTKSLPGASNRFTIVLDYSERSPVETDYQSYRSTHPDQRLFLHEFLQGPIAIEPGKDYFVNIMFISPKDLPVGEYLFDIVTCYDNGDAADNQLSTALCGSTAALPDQYGMKQRLYITVR